MIRMSLLLSVLLSGASLLAQDSLRCLVLAATIGPIDRATWLTLKAELSLQVLVEGDEALLNHISLVPVDPKRFPAVRAKEAAILVAWLTDPDQGQRHIQAFGRERFGQSLFFPESRAFQARTPRKP